MKMNNAHGIWTTQTGLQQPITALTDHHLTNILRMLYKPDTVAKLRAKLLKKAKGEDGRAVIDSGSMFDNPAGLAASEHADELRNLAQSPDLDVILHRWPQLPHLEFEARRRGLSI